MISYLLLLLLLFQYFIIDSYTVFASFYVEGIAGENVSSRRLQRGGSL